MDSTQLVTDLRGAKYLDEVRNLLKRTIPSETEISQLSDPQKSWVEIVVKELQSTVVTDDDGVAEPPTATTADEGALGTNTSQPSPLEDVAQKVLGGRDDASPGVEPKNKSEPS